MLYKSPIWFSDSSTLLLMAPSILKKKKNNRKFNSSTVWQTSISADIKCTEWHCHAIAHFSLSISSSSHGAITFPLPASCQLAHKSDSKHRYKQRLFKPLDEPCLRNIGQLRNRLPGRTLEGPLQRSWEPWGHVCQGYPTWNSGKKMTSFFICLHKKT